MTKNINSYIDHTILKPEADEAKVSQIIEEAKKYHFASVCINPTWVNYTSEKLRGTGVATCTVIGFPLGANTSAVKTFEAQKAIIDGADEIDMVVNIGAVKSGNWDLVEEDILAVNGVKADKILKVIIETCLLTDEEKVRVCQIAKGAGADFVKTSTGFSTAGATVADVELMRQTVGSDMGVKASGGIHSLEEAEAMIAAGASRLGCSAGVSIMEDAEQESAEKTNVEVLEEALEDGDGDDAEYVEFSDNSSEDDVDDIENDLTSETSDAD